MGEENTLAQGNLIVREFGSCDTIKNQGVSVSVSLWEPSDSSKVSEISTLSLPKRALNALIPTQIQRALLLILVQKIV
jgi:hypothetical protein